MQSSESDHEDRTSLVAIYSSAVHWDLLVPLSIMKSRFLLTIVTVAIFSACSEAPQKVAEKAPEAPPEPISGSTTFFRMYTAARGWLADVQWLRMTSINLPDVKKVTGKAAAWQVTFVSAENQRARPYTFSGIEAPSNLHKGVWPLTEASSPGPRG